MKTDSAKREWTTCRLLARNALLFSAATLLDGIINLDTDRAKVLGFTSDKYEGYLWKQGDAVMVSFIVSKQRGNFRELVRRIHALGLTVKVPTPLGRMQEILLKNGYQHTQESFDEAPGEMVDVWVLMPSNVESETWRDWLGKHHAALDLEKSEDYGMFLAFALVETRLREIGQYTG